MLPGKKRKIGIAIGSLIIASGIIAGVTIPIVLKKQTNDKNDEISSNFSKLQAKFDKINKELNITQTSDIDLATSSGQKAIKDFIFSLKSFTNTEKEAIFLITKKGVITSKSRLEVVFAIKIDDQKKEYNFNVRHFSSNDELKLYNLKQKIDTYDRQEIIVIDQTKELNQILIKQTIIDEINKVNVKKLSTEEKNALSFKDNNISLSGLEEKNIVMFITFGKEIYAYTFIISLQKPTDETNFKKLKNKFDSLNQEWIVPRTTNLNLNDVYNRNIVKNFFFTLKNFTTKEKEAISIITKNGTINKNNYIDVVVKIGIGNKKENTREYTFKLKTSLGIDEINFIKLKNKFNKVNFKEAITLPIIQIIDLSVQNARQILLDKIIDYVDNLNLNDVLNQAEKNALTIETKLGLLSSNQSTNVDVTITFGIKNHTYNFKILKMQNQNEINFNSLKIKFDKFKRYNDKKSILWKIEYDNHLYRQKFYDVIFQSINEQNPNNHLNSKEKSMIKIDFFSRSVNGWFLLTKSTRQNFAVKIFLNHLEKIYRFTIERENMFDPKDEDQDGIAKFKAKLKKVITRSKSNPNNLIEIESSHDIDLSNDSYHDFLYNEIIDNINKKNLGNELTIKEKNSIPNAFQIKIGESINFFNEVLFLLDINYYNFHDLDSDRYYVKFKRKKDHQLIFDNLKSRFDQTNNKEIILENELQNLSLSHQKIIDSIIKKVNEFNADNLIKNEEKKYISIKNHSDKINYNDWTNATIEINVNSIKKEYTFKIKRKKQNKEKFDDLEAKMKIIKPIKFIAINYDPLIFDGLKLLIFKKINDQLKLIPKNELNQEEKNAIKLLSYDIINKPDKRDIFYDGDIINLKIGIQFGDLYDFFIIKVSR